MPFEHPRAAACSLTGRRSVVSAPSVDRTNARTVSRVFAPLFGSLFRAAAVCATIGRIRATFGLLRWFVRDVYGITTDITAGALLDAQGAKVA